MDSPPQPARFAVVDVETSGLSLRRGNVLQVGVVLLDEQFAVVQRWTSLVAPRRRWWFRVGPTHVHGIRRRDLRGAPAGADVLRRLDSLLSGTTVVAHNAAFDTAFLHKAARRHRVPLHLGTPLCTLQLSRRLDPDRQASHRLADVCQRYGVPLVRAHDALSDAEATAGVLPHLLHAHGLSAADATDQLATPS
jgi:DNA polymerase-3 subunit epsilon